MRFKVAEIRRDGPAYYLCFQLSPLCDRQGFSHYYVFDGTDGDFIFLDYRDDTRGVGVRCVGAGV